APIDTVTQQVEAALRYGGESLQAQLGYYGSFFSNDKDFLQWQNPYTAAGGWDPSAGFNCSGATTAAGCGTGQKSLPPDNAFHQILASGGYDLPYQTRATLSTAFGWMEQDDNYLPYSVNSALTAITPAGAPVQANDPSALPRRSPDAEIFTTVVDFRLASRPLPKLHLDLAYHLDDRDNDTPRNVYTRIRGDAEDQDPARARINLPYSFEQHRIDFDAGYQVWRRTDLTLGYQWERTERDFQERDYVTENTLDAVLTSHPWAGVSARINYEHSWRDGDRYRGNDPFLDSHVGADPNDFENHPLLRKYYLADRDRDEIQLMLALQPLENLSLGINASYVDEDYDDTDAGLTKVTGTGSGIDLSWTPIERLTTHAFYSYQRFETEQDGWSFFGGGFGFDDPSRRWDSSDTDRTHTVGVGFSWNVLPELSLGADYLFADSRGDTDVDVGSALDAGVPYPKTRSRQHNLSLYGEYRFTPNLSTRVGYLYESFSRDDWALDGIAPTSLSCFPNPNACVIGSGRASEGYTASVVSWSVIYKFW
ncbi:MAG: MtrB/PioB family decaheme-associated outer membrane protein, partial [Myxococcota bacterium]